MPGKALAMEEDEPLWRGLKAAYIELKAGWTTMSYIEKTLGAHERIIARAKFHWIYHVAAWLALIFLGVLIIGIVIFFQIMIRIWTTEIGVTTYRFIEKKGLFTLRTNEITLPNIEGVRVNQSIMGRILGYGHLRIEGTGIDAVSIPAIADPLGFRRAIETAREEATAARPPAAGSASQ